LEIIFSEKYWGLIFLISLILASGITLLVYYKSRDTVELRPWQRTILMVLRFLAIFFVTLLLSGPLLKTLRKIIQNPVVILAIDNSTSVTGFSEVAAIVDEKLAMIDKISQSLREKFDVIRYTFGEEVLRENQPQFSEKRSAYSDVIQAVYNNHFNENVGALLLIGDGIYNQGENPVNVARQLNYPVYTLALGDTTAHRDVRVAAVRINRNAFLGNKFPVEIDIRYQGMPNQNIRFNIQHRGVSVFSENIYTRESDGFMTISTYLDADNKGLQYYTALVETNLDEKNKLNNSQQFVINVLENKQRILIISNGSHPDGGALKDALEGQINYEVSLFTEEPYPASIKEFNLLVLCQIPSSSQSGRQIIDEANRSRVPILMMIGSQTHIPQFNLIGLGTEITLQAGNMEEAQPIVNKSFAAFTLSEKLQANMERYPPLKVPFARYQLDAMWNVIAFQRIRNIETDRPIMAVANRNGVKAGIIFGEGIWRWRMYNYLMSDSHAEFTELMDKLVQYLALRDNEDNFVIDFRPVYNETDPIIMTAEVYNDAYEPINTPEVSLILRDSVQQEFVYLFDRGNQFYRLDAGVFPPGDYRFEAKVEIGNQTYTETGNFAVMPVNIELLETQANHRMLYQLAQQSGGGFFLPTDTETLIENIISNSRIKPFTYFQSLLSEILNLRWIFFIFLAILSLEWFLRKYWGIY
jgi:hypothetical protein